MSVHFKLSKIDGASSEDLDQLGEQGNKPIYFREQGNRFLSVIWKTIRKVKTEN